MKSAFGFFVFSCICAVAWAMVVLVWVFSEG